MTKIQLLFASLSTFALTAVALSLPAIRSLGDYLAAVWLGVVAMLAGLGIEIPITSSTWAGLVLVAVPVGILMKVGRRQFRSGQLDLARRSFFFTIAVMAFGVWLSVTTTLSVQEIMTSASRHSLATV